MQSDPRVAYVVREYKRLAEELTSLDGLKKDGMDDLVLQEKKTITEQMNALKKQISDIVGDGTVSEETANEIILEVRAGAGGDEASIFSRDLAANV